MTVTAAIMQPTYLPYLGYFELIAAADVFVFLDDVQLARRSWQSRNRILTASGELMLTVPTKKAPREARLDAIEIDDGQPWRERHLAAIRHAYSRRPGFGEGMAFLEETLTPAGRLADMTCALIEAAAGRLGLAPRFVRANALGCGGARSEHLLAICRAVGADAYVSPMGSADYMTEDAVFEAADFPVRFQGFSPMPYPQGATPFTPYMAFIDAVMNLGWADLATILQRRAGEDRPGCTPTA